MKRVIYILMAALVLVWGRINGAELFRNETLRYGMYLGPIKGGEAKLETRLVNYEGRQRVQMDLIARTNGAAEKIFSLNDTLCTIVDKSNAAPVYFRKHCFEGDDIVLERVSFTHGADGSCTASMRKDYKDGRVKERTETSRESIYDMVSVVGFARTIDKSTLYKGKSIDFKLTDACNIKDETLVYEGKENVRISGKKYDCMVFRLMEPYVEKGKKKQRDILVIYVTDDSNRTIVQMDIKFKVGTAKIKLIR